MSGVFAGIWGIPPLLIDKTMPQGQLESVAVIDHVMRRQKWYVLSLRKAVCL